MTAKTPAAPKVLCKAGAAKWRSIVRSDVWGGLITPADFDQLEEYCRLFVRKEHAEAKVMEHGPVVASPNGFPVQSPWLQIVNKCRADMNKIATAFGGSPAARKKSEDASAPQGKKAAAADAAREVAGGSRFRPVGPPNLRAVPSGG